MEVNSGWIFIRDLAKEVMRVNKLECSYIEAKLKKKTNMQE